MMFLIVITICGLFIFDIYFRFEKEVVIEKVIEKVIEVKTVEVIKLDKRCVELLRINQDISNIEY